MIEQPASPAYADLISGYRPKHPGGRGLCQHDPYIELALIGQRARCDERRISGPGSPALRIATSMNRMMYSFRLISYSCFSLLNA